MKLCLADNAPGLIASQTRSPHDEELLHQIGAGQRLFGGIDPTGSIRVTAQATSKESVGTGFNQSW